MESKVGKNMTEGKYTSGGCTFMQAICGTCRGLIHKSATNRQEIGAVAIWRMGYISTDCIPSSFAKVLILYGGNECSTNIPLDWILRRP